MLHSFLIDIIAWVQYGSRSRLKTGQLFEVQALGQLVELSVDLPGTRSPSNHLIR